MKTVNDNHQNPEHTCSRNRLLVLIASVISLISPLSAGATDIRWEGLHFSEIVSESVTDRFDADKAFYLYNVGQKMFLNVGGSYDAEPVLTNVGMKMAMAWDTSIGGGRALLRTSINNSGNRYCLGMRGDANNTAQPIRVLCDLTPDITRDTEENYLYKTQSGWFISPVTAGSKVMYIRNCRRGDVPEYDHLYYNPSTRRVEVGDNQDDDNAKWLIVSIEEYRRQMLALREGNIEVTAFIEDSRFNRNNLWQNCWTWQDSSSRLHNIGESEDVADASGNVLKSGMGFPAVQAGTDQTRGGIGVNYYSQLNVAEIKGETNRLSQTVSGLPKGMYKITCQGFYHDGGNGTATDASCYLFANAQRTTLRPRNDISRDNPDGKFDGSPVTYLWKDNGQTYGTWRVTFDGTDGDLTDPTYKHTFCTADGNGYPTDGMAAAKYFNFSETNCVNEGYVNLREGEDLQLGVNKGAENGWVAVDNFRLYYLGNYEYVLDEDALPSQTVNDDLFSANVNFRRTLGDKWTSIVLPFDLTQEQFDEAFSADASVSELVGVDPDYEYRILFKQKDRVASDQTYMEAGKHYIICGAKDPAYSENETYSFITNNNNALTTVLQGPLYQISNVTRVNGVAQPNLFNLVVHTSGNAYDHSYIHHKVETLTGSNLSARLNTEYGRTEALMANAAGQAAADSYYKVNYGENASFMEAMKEQHTVAVLFKANNATGTDAALIGALTGGKGFGMELAGGDVKYSLCTPDVTTVSCALPAEADGYRHVVATWNGETKKMRIYVDGEMKSEVTASGNEVSFPATADCIMNIGCGADGNGAFNGSIVMARIYDKALSDEQVGELYRRLVPIADKPEIKHTVSNGRDRYLKFTGAFGYDESAPAPKGAYFVSGGKMYHLTSDLPLYGFRGYIQETDELGNPLNTPAATLSLRISGSDGETTDITAAGIIEKESLATACVYDLRGVAVRRGTTSTDGLPKGIYIVNGRKRVVK